MALYRRGTASMDADGTVHGTDTKWKDQLSLIRVGATIVFLEQPIKLAVISDIVSDTELKAISTDGQTAADGKYVILLSDSLTVNGLAQNVAETLRYYQSKETEIASALDIIADLDMDNLNNIVQEIKANKSAAEDAQNQAELARDASVSAKDAAAVSAQEAKDAANSVNADNLLTKDGNLAGLEDKKESRKNLQLGESDVVTFESVAVKKEAVDANASTAGIYHSILYGADGSDIGSSQSYFETQQGVGKHTIAVYKTGGANYTHMFYPDGRTHSAQYTGITQQMGWDDPNNWGNALVWGETVANNDRGWAPGLSWATKSTGGYPIRATWGLMPQGTNAWPLCALRLRGDGSMFCNFQFHPASNDISTWSSSGNFIFQKAASSDRDIKHDIIYTDGKDSYDRVMQWLPTMFKYNGSEIQRYGMIAQDLLKIDMEYVKIIPGGDIFAEVIGLDDNGNEYVDREIVVDKADDTLALDNNVIMADMACAMVYMGNRMEEMRKELDEIKKLLSK